MRNNDIVYGLAEINLWLANYGHKDFAETVDKACGIIEKFRWIPMSKRLPDEVNALFLLENGKITTGMWINGNLVVPVGLGQFKPFSPVTHWMPLPEPPKGGECE